MPAPPLHAARGGIVGVIATTLLTTVLSAVIGLLLARHYPREEYGRLAYFISLFGGFRLLAALGLTSQVMIETARCHGRGEPVESEFYPLLMVRLLSSTVIGLATLGSGWVLGDETLMIAALAGALALLADFLIGTIQALGRLGAVMLLQFLQPCIYAVWSAGVVWLALPVDAVFAALLGSFVCSMLVASVVLTRHLQPPRRTMLRLRDMRGLVRQAGGMYMLAILGTLFTSCATLYLGWSARFADAALLAVSLYITLLPASLAGTVLTTMFFPQLVAAYARGAPEQARELMIRLYDAVAALSALAAAGMLWYPHVLLGILYGTRYQESASLLLLSAPAACLYALYTVAQFSAVARGRIDAPIRSHLTAMAIALGAVVLAAQPGGSLLWVSAGYSVAALLGLLWLARPGAGLGWTLIMRAGIQLVGAVALIGGARLLIPDTLQALPAAAAMLTIAGLGYVGWAWRRMGRI